MLVLYAVIDCIMLYRGSSFNTTVVRVGVASIFSILGWMCMLTGHSLRGLDRVFTVYPLIEIGRFFNNYNLLVTMKNSRRLQAASISIIILAIGYRFGNIALVNNRIVNPIFFLLMSIAGWFVLLSISDIIMKYTHIKSICELFSKRSIWIIGGHFLAFKIVTKIQIIVMGIEPFKLAAFPVLIEGYFWSTLYTIIGLLFPLLVGLAVDKFLLKEMHRVY